MVPKKIMIVEDEVIVGMDLKKKVQRLGYTVDSEVIRYGEAVLEAAQKSRPDLILMDIRLKGEMDGAQAASQIKDTLGLPVVFLTAYSDQGTLDKAKISEPYAYLKKPVRPDDLKISLELTLYRAELQKQLAESEIRFRTVADYTYDWETWITPSGKYLYVSPACERVTGYGVEDFMEDPQFFYTIVHPDDRERIGKEFEHHRQSEGSDHFSEFRIIRKEGEERWIEHFCRPVHGPSGAYLGRRASNRDISVRKALEISLEQKIAELQSALGSIRTLKGLIPICANCKKIRDDEGYWTQVESYIQQNSDARFSHGICPACVDKLYGHEEWYQAIKNK